MKLQLKGDTGLIRRFMIAERKAIDARIRMLEKEWQEQVNGGGTGLSIDSKIYELEEKRKKYIVAYNRPALFKGIVVNFSLLNNFVKKLKGYEVEIVKNEKSVVVNYSTSTTEGAFELYDLSKFYNVKDLPKVVISR